MTAQIKNAKSKSFGSGAKLPDDDVKDNLLTLDKEGHGNSNKLFNLPFFYLK